MSASTHTLTVHDPVTGTDRIVKIVIHGQSNQWRFHASFEGLNTMLTHGDNLWFDTEAEVLALAKQKVHEEISRSRRAGPF